MGVAIIIPLIFCCSSVFSVIFCYSKSHALGLCPSGIPESVYTLEEHKRYLDVLEIYRRTWLAHIDFLRDFENIDKATYLAQYPQSAAYYDDLNTAYQFFIGKINNGLNFEAIANDFDKLTKELEEAILLEDPSFVNAWRTSEFETEEEINHEAMKAFRQYFGNMYR